MGTKRGREDVESAPREGEKLACSQTETAASIRSGCSASTNEKVTVFGSGSFGTAMAIVVARNGYEVC